MSVTIASHIGQYRIVRKIGAGGMGLVFLGEHTLLGRRAAIKTLLPTVSANREIVERFFNEARATSTISDPGVIQIFDFGYHVDGTAYIVMELLEGEALSARIARLGRLSLASALRLARQIAGSLAAAHAHGVVHRDLKPENIFLICDAEAQGGERTKILDFGVCKVAAGDPALTQSGAMIGTPVYMSPEQCRGADDVDHRADIYAFGCLVFHMLTGRPPFVGEIAGELIVAHLEEDPPAPSLYVSELPLAVDALVLRCLAKSPDDRYPSMAEIQLVLCDLYATLDGSETAVAAVPPEMPEMPLGRGFRSVYDGNLTGGGGRSSRDALMTPRIRPWPQRTPTPVPTPVPTPTPTPAADQRDGLPPRRARRLAVLTCVLVIGMVIGLLATSLVVSSQVDRVAPPTAGIELHPAASPALETTSGRAPRPATASAATATDRAPRPVASAATVAPPRHSREAPRESKHPAASPRRRPAALPARPSAPLAEDLYETR
jgi:serine/threonine protein kinase